MTNMMPLAQMLRRCAIVLITLLNNQFKLLITSWNLLSLTLIPYPTIMITAFFISTKVKVLLMIPKLGKMM